MIKDDEFLRIAHYMKQHYGIDLGQKKVIMNGRLENYIKRGGWANFHEFMNDLQKDNTGKFEKELVNMLTTNYTYFMREFEHFEFFRDQVLPWARRRAEASKDLRIWCGAASTGEEPYMIAMVIRDFLGLDVRAWDSTVLATDISTKALGEAIKGIYNEEALDEMPEAWKRHFFKSAGNNRYAVTSELKDAVLFRQFNLMSPFPFKKRMHAVFLRNVMIYFDVETKHEVLRKVYDALEPGGYLFIGMTETLDRSRVPFIMIQPSIFRKKEG